VAGGECYEGGRVSGVTEYRPRYRASQKCSEPYSASAAEEEQLAAILVAEDLHFGCKLPTTMELQFEARGPGSVRRQQPSRASKLHSWTIVGGTILVAWVVTNAYSPFFRPVIELSPNTKPGDPAVVIYGTASPIEGAVTIIRDNESWEASTYGRRFVAAVPLHAGLNHIQVVINGRVSNAMALTGPSAPVQDGSEALSGDCRGTLTAFPRSGYTGDPFSVTVQLDPSASLIPISRVAAGCRRHEGDSEQRCPVPKAGTNQFATVLYFLPDTSREDFQALDNKGNVRCSGSISLTPLGERP
jgi:hypothetical protein